MDARYVNYWTAKGAYGLERIRRAEKRKKERREKMLRCPRCNWGQKSFTPHTCPYQTDMHGDYDTLCKCCDECRHTCSMDI